MRIGKEHLMKKLIGLFTLILITAIIFNGATQESTDINTKIRVYAAPQNLETDLPDFKLRLRIEINETDPIDLRVKAGLTAVFDNISDILLVESDADVILSVSTAPNILFVGIDEECLENDAYIGIATPNIPIPTELIGYDLENKNTGAQTPVGWIGSYSVPFVVPQTEKASEETYFKVMVLISAYLQRKLDLFKELRPVRDEWDRILK